MAWILLVYASQFSRGMLHIILHLMACTTAIEGGPLLEGELNPSSNVISSIALSPSLIAKP